jgi:hypothetical protein
MKGRQVTCRGYGIRLAFCMCDQGRIRQIHQSLESELMQVWNFTAWAIEPVMLHMLNCLQKLFKFLCRNSNLRKIKFWVHSRWQVGLPRRLSDCKESAGLVSPPLFSFTAHRKTSLDHPNPLPGPLTTTSPSRKLRCKWTMDDLN